MSLHKHMPPAARPLHCLAAEACTAHKRACQLNRAKQTQHTSTQRNMTPPASPQPTWHDCTACSCSSRAILPARATTCALCCHGSQAAVRCGPPRRRLLGLPAGCCTTAICSAAPRIACRVGAAMWGPHAEPSGHVGMTPRQPAQHTRSNQHAPFSLSCRPIAPHHGCPPASTPRRVCRP